MTTGRRQKVLEFEERHKNLDNDSFYKLAEMRGIKPEEFVEAEEQHVEEKEKNTDTKTRSASAI